MVDAYLTPLLQAYLDELARELPGSRLRMMQSSGGLTDAARFRGRDAVLSGPAGGAVALLELQRRAGEAQVIGFDMGGTSTDVSRCAGELERVYETRVAGVRLRTPMHRHPHHRGGRRLAVPLRRHASSRWGPRAPARCPGRCVTARPRRASWR